MKKRAYSAALLSVLLISALLIVFSLLSASLAFAAESTANAQERLPAFLSEVLNIDLAKYTILGQGCGTKYPTQLGGVVKEETMAITYNSTSSEFNVGSVFRNGYIAWFSLCPLRGSIIYREQLSTSAVTETRNILERYKVYAEKYGINATHVTSALSMLGKASDAPGSGNFNGISNFNIEEEISGYVRMKVSKSRIDFGQIFNGAPLHDYGEMGITFSNSFGFHDVWGLYEDTHVSVITKEEATAMALDAAKNSNLTLTGENNSSYVVYPDWSNPTVEIGLNMILGQSFNTELNSRLQGVNSGNTTREPLDLYPFWMATVYFTKPIGSISGIQVGIWGDTKEIAYVHTYGHLGNSEPEPFPTMLVAVSVALIVAVVSFGLVAYSLRRKGKRSQT